MRLAAIDIGTNSVHMIVVRVRPDLSFEVVDREKEMIRLGAGGLDGRRLAPTAVTAAYETLARFRRLAEAHDVDEILATATSAVREAENGGDFVATVRRDLGIRIRIISGKEEARLIHLAAAYAAGVGGHPSVVVDIGGGSVEITYGTAARMQSGGSFKVGVIRLTERFVTSDPLSRADEQKMVRHIRRQTGTYLKSLVARGFHRVIGTSGTIHALGVLASAPLRDGGDLRNRKIPTKALGRVRRLLTSLTLEERLALPGLDPRRADVTVAGAVLLDTVLAALGADSLTLCDFALREGLVLDYIKRNGAHIRTVERYPDVRRRSVIELAERCLYIAPHAQQVARTALALFDATQPEHQLGADAREWLEYAALLHDIGTHISYERHHRHSQYLIQHGDLRGFDPDEIQLMALVARYHRQSPPKKSHAEFGALPEADRRVVRVLGALLRLAEGLDRSHAQVVEQVETERTETDLLVRLRTTSDPELELWAAARHAAPLIKVLGRPIRFAAEPCNTKFTRSKLVRNRPSVGSSA
jgi:exopolyphosphatase/guanosine-5'-triphosphate,3'-diphosphate pyrophosphatase